MIFAAEIGRELRQYNIFANGYKEFVEILLTQDSFCQDIPEESLNSPVLKKVYTVSY